MRRSQFDYHSYRGRTTFTDWLKRIALVLAILVVLAAILLFLGWKFNPDDLRSSLPFSSSNSQTEETSTPETDRGGEEQTGPVPDHSQDTNSGQETPVADPTPASALLSVSLTSLLDGSALQLAEQGGADGIVVNMKNDWGALGWQSQQPLASSLQSGISPQTVNDSLMAWNQGELYTVARFSCFRDEALGSQMEYTLRTSSNYRWRDQDDFHWSAPSNLTVQDYLVNLMVELAQLGFDEIVLDSWGYPSQADGTLGNIQRGENYPEGSLDSITTAFLEKAALALAPYPVRLSLTIPEPVLTGADPSTGLTSAVLAAHIDCIWTDADRTAALSALTASNAPWTEDRLVSLTVQLDSTLPIPQAVWTNE